MHHRDRNPAGSAQSGQVPVLDTSVHGKRLHADEAGITHGRKSIALDEVEWVSYWAAHTATKRLLFPTTDHSDWYFAVGTYPHKSGQVVTVHSHLPGRRDDPPDSWTFLVDLSRRFLEPRLLTDLVTRVRRGETVTVGGDVRVDRHGIACAEPEVSVPWQSISRTQPDNDTVRIYQAGVEKPVLSVPRSNPNAGLMPALFATLAS